MSKKFRFLIVLVLVVVMGTFIWPTINWYFILPEPVKTVASGTRTQIREESQRRAQIAVRDFRQLANSDPSAPVPTDYEFVLNAAKEVYAANENFEEPEVWTVSHVVAAFRSADALEEVIETKFRNDILVVKDQKSKIIQLGLDLSGGMSVVVQADPAQLTERLGQAPSAEQYSEALDLAVEVLRSRVDRFGISEPSIRKDEGANRILIDIPGDNDRDRVNSLLLGSGSLALQIVDGEATQALDTYQTEYKTRTGLSWNPQSETPPDLIPAGTQARPFVQKDEYGIDYTVRYIVTKEDETSKVDGTYITDASPSSAELTGAPTATFTMTAEGGEKFRVLTRDNVGQSMAIVLDGAVRAYANISGEIPSGRVEITGLSRDEASDISKVLKTAALPLDLKIESVNAVGASLGEDAIKAGTLAAAIGFGAVLLFMIVYYLGAGIVANIALILNVYFMLAVLSVFNLTLTLTSIAGLILTVGMAVDANVIIFERIKEELRQGKARAAAIAAGYKKAFWTILDSNITTIIASILLAYLGTGPIQGFAVTLTVGIMTSLFTALFVTHLLQDIGTEQLKRTRVSIAWRLK